MKIKKVFAILFAMVLSQCGAALADTVTVVVGNGQVYTRNEFDMSGTGQVSAYNYGKSIYSADGNPITGEIVLGFGDGTAAVSKYNALGTIITSGMVADSSHGGGHGILGAAIRPNGDIYFGSYSGWVYARSRKNVTVAPAGYGGSGSVQFSSSGGRYMYLASSPLDEVMIVSNDWGKLFIRQGNNMSATPIGYQGDGMELAASVTARLTLSTGDVVFASTAGNPSVYLFVRDNEDLSIAPAGYVDHAIMGTGVSIRALARTANDLLVVGNLSGEVILVDAHNVGVQLGYTVLPNAIYALAITSNNNVVIGLNDGRVFVRSLSDINGDDITVPMNFGAAIVKIAAINPDDVWVCEDIVANGQAMAGDLNGDCYVNFEDFAMFALDWAKCDDPQNENCQ